jgi:O-antigen ligase
MSLTSRRELPRDPLILLLLALTWSLPLARPPVLQIGALPVQLADVLVGLLFAGFAIRWLRGRVKLRMDPILAVSLLYVAVLALSVMLGRESHTKGLLKLAAYSLYLLLPALTVRLVDDDKKLAWLVRGWLLGGLTAAAIGAVGLIAWYADRNGIGKSFGCATYGLLPSGNYPRLCASFRSPNMFANYLIILIALALGCGRILARPRWLWLAVILGSVVALFTLSAGMGGYALAGALALTAAWRIRGVKAPLRSKVLLAGASAVAIFFAVSMTAVLTPPGEGQVTVAGRGIDFWGSSRPKIWAASLDTIAAHPVLGKGYGTLVAYSTDPKVLLSPDQISAQRGPKAGWLEAHNIWLNVAGQAGIVGLLVFVAMLVVMLRGLPSLALARLRAGPGDPHYSQGTKEMQTLPAAVCAALIGALLYHGLFGALEESRHLWPLLALAAATVAVARANGEQPNQPAGR